eukprot:TRINITY_DN22255_c0_g1_i1.p1 TRINITY_DN22255_c0_g1~~TRINITY_DN22255_c0_g1_i1.p1  ORF type:complete len:329 (-),score=49.97 TRINITY_DN22255_c0_g1_i1:246-1232(-)
MILRPPRSTLSSSSAASDVYKRQVIGRIDHMAVGPGVLVVNALTSNLSLVLNSSNGSILQAFPLLPNPQGAAIASTSPTVMALANALDGSVRLFDWASRTGRFELKSTLQLGQDADNVRWDQASGRFLVGYGSGPSAGVAEIQPGRGVVGRARVPGHPESFQILNRSHLAVNVPSANGSIAIVDRRSLEVTRLWGVWSMGGEKLDGNFPMAVLPDRGLLLVGTREPAMLALLDSSTGRTVSAVASVGDTDDIWWDAERQRVYQTGGQGLIATFALMDDDELVRLADTPTSALARTSLFVPESRLLYLAVPKTTPTADEAAVWIYACMT